MTDPTMPLFSATLSMLPKVLALIALVAGVTLAVRHYFPRIKGSIGEKRVRGGLRALPPNYRVVNDILLKTRRGMSQIDHVVVSPYGIFVIETKTYDGRIIGTEGGQCWTQVLPRSNKEFYNPVRQNYGHIQALRELLHEYHDLPYHSIIVFGGNCDLKDVQTSTPVLYEKDVAAHLLGVKGNLILPDRDIERIELFLRKADRKDHRARVKHIEEVRARKAAAGRR